MAKFFRLVVTSCLCCNLLYVLSTSKWVNAEGRELADVISSRLRHLGSGSSGSSSESTTGLEPNDDNDQYSYDDDLLLVDDDAEHGDEVEQKRRIGSAKNVGRQRLEVPSRNFKRLNAETTLDDDKLSESLGREAGINFGWNKHGDKSDLMERTQRRLGAAMNLKKVKIRDRKNSKYSPNSRYVPPARD